MHRATLPLLPSRHRIAAGIALLALAGCANAACMRYAEEIELTGRLVRQTYNEPVRTPESRKGEPAATYYFMALPEAGCVEAGNAIDGSEPPEQELTRIQLVFLNSAAYRQWRPYLGKDMICRGSLFHASTAHHHAPILMLDARCRPPLKPKPPAAVPPAAPAPAPG